MSEFEPKYDKMRPPNEWKDWKMDFFECSDEISISTLSTGLTKAESLEYFNIEYDDLEADDQFFFDCCYNKGRANSKNNAINHLFNQMRAKGGTNACMEYLTRFADKWPENEGDATARGRTFKLVID